MRIQILIVGFKGLKRQFPGLSSPALQRDGKICTRCMTSCSGPINLFILYFVCFRREGELLSRQKDVKKISELIYLELTVRMLAVFEIVQFENSPL